jgi:hypothetical protein
VFDRLTASYNISVLIVLKLLLMSSRTEENTFITPPSGDFSIPLLPHGGFGNIACLDADASAPEQGPFPDPDLGTLFSSESEVQEDVRGERELLARTTRWQQAHCFWKFIKLHCRVHFSTHLFLPCVRGKSQVSSLS